MNKNKERITDMENYFHTYIKYIRNHYIVDNVCTINGIKDTNQDSTYDKYNIRSYYQLLNITLSPEAQDDYSEIKNTLINDVATIMGPKNYKNGSTTMNLESKNNSKDNVKECILKIYYAPENPVYDFQIKD
jgi:hypothetical protein